MFVTNAQSGEIAVASGDSHKGPSGTVSLQSGSARRSGDVQIASGTHSGDRSGDVFLHTGGSYIDSFAGDTGAISIATAGKSVRVDLRLDRLPGLTHTPVCRHIEELTRKYRELRLLRFFPSSLPSSHSCTCFAHFYFRVSPLSGPGQAEPSSRASLYCSLPARRRR